MADNIVVELKNTEAKFLDFANKSFPLDCEGFSDKQLNEKLISVLGNIGGSKYILMGCDAPNGYAGYVFLATIDNPSGELLYVEPGAPTASLYLKKTTVDITASGYDYVGAYIKRTLAWGVGVENFTWSEFKKLETNAQLSAKITSLQTTLAGIVPEAVGSMKFWAGPLVTIPTNWVIMDGASLLKADYPELFAVIGIMYGSVAETHFNLPVMQGRLPAAYKTTADPDFNRLGSAAFGGEKAVTLTTAQVPNHTHTTNLDSGNATGNFNSIAANHGQSAYAGTVTSSATGGDQSHNNLPPYHVFPFIIKVK